MQYTPVLVKKLSQNPLKLNQIYRGLEFLFSCLLLPTLSALINDQFSTLLANSLGKQQDIFAHYSRHYPYVLLSPS